MIVPTMLLGLLDAEIYSCLRKICILIQFKLNEIPLLEYRRIGIIDLITATVRFRRQKDDINMHIELNAPCPLNLEINCNLSAELHSISIREL
jgi:hypothetical protein